MDDRDIALNRSNNIGLDLVVVVVVAVVVVVVVVGVYMWVG